MVASWIRWDLIQPLQAHYGKLFGLLHLNALMTLTYGQVYTFISFSWYLVCKLLAMALLNLFTVDIAE